MNFYFYGPYRLPIDDSNGLISRDSRVLKDFWDDVVDNPKIKDHAGLSYGCGCYLFGLRSGGGIKIHYVGQANRQSFRKEALTPSKRELYNSAMRAQDKGAPVLFLVARHTNNRWDFSPPAKSREGYRDITFLEDYFMAAALARNPKLLNKKGLKLLRSIYVPGVLNHDNGNPGGAASLVKKALQI
jgi:hypothetical protein